MCRVNGEVIDGLESIEPLRESWDALAVACSRPYAAPAWQLGWWRHAAPPGARPLALVARDRGRVAGLIALYAERTPTGMERLRVMGAPLAQGTGAVMVPGREPEVARAFAHALAAARPRFATLELEGVLGGEEWARWLRAGWPGASRPHLLHDQRVTAPAVEVAGAASLEDWLGARSSNFRGQVRRAQRKLVARGARFWRAGTAQEVETVLPALLALHEERWSDRGGSQAVDGDTGAVLAEAARQFGEDCEQRYWIEAIELDGKTVSAHLFVAAGSEATYWLGGFDESVAAEKPGVVALVQGVGHAIALGVAHVDLGPGEHPYKYRLADGSRELDWLRLVLPGPRRPLTHLQLAPRRAARDVAARMGPERTAHARARLEALRARVGSSG